MKKEEMVELLLDAGIDASMEMKKEELEKLLEDNSELFEVEGEVEEAEGLTIVLARKHPRKTMRLGRHMISTVKQKFILNADEEKELVSKGGKAWFKVLN